MKKKWLFWLPVGAATIWAGSHLLPGFRHFGHFGGHDMMQSGSGQGMMQGGRGPGMMGHGGRHGFGFDFGWTRTLIGAGIALFGISQLFLLRVP